MIRGVNAGMYRTRCRSTSSQKGSVLTLPPCLLAGLDEPIGDVKSVIEMSSCAPARLRDGGDVSVVEVDRLVQSAAEGRRVAGENIVSGDLAAFDLRDPTFG